MYQRTRNNKAANATSITSIATSTVLINWPSKKVRDCYNVHAVLLAIILLLIIVIFCYHYTIKSGK